MEEMNDMKRQLQGIVLVLFGILLGVCGDSINSTILSNMADAPFGLFGVCIGVLGLYFAFAKEKENKNGREDNEKR